MSGHAPGPWTFRESDNDEGCFYEIMGPWRNGARAWVGGAEMEADAILITAAPDMLAALQTYLALDVYEKGPDWYEAMRAAVAKATGAALSQPATQQGETP